MLLPLMDKYGPTINWTLTGALPNGALFERASNALAIGPDGLLIQTGHNDPRFELYGLLAEQQSTNLMWPSSRFSSDRWESGPTCVEGQMIAPDGTLSGARCTANGKQWGGIFRNWHAPYAPNTTYAGSIYIKKGNHPYVGIALGDQASAFFNLDTKALIKTTGAPLSYGIRDVGNGWFRLSLVATQPALPNGYFDYYICSSTGDVSWTPSGTEFLYAWGVQLEVGAFVTSHIPTTDGPATRARDIVSIDASLVQPDEGTILLEGIWNGSDLTYGGVLLWLNDGDMTNYFAVGIDTTGRVNGFINSQTTGWGMTQVSDPIQASSIFKVAVSYKSGANMVAVNGVVLQDNGFGGASVLPNVSRVRLMSNHNGGSFADGYIRRFSFSKKAKTRTELEALTR